MKKLIFFLTLIVSISICTAAEEKKPLTIEWIVSDQCRDLTALPRFTWVEDGTILLYDTTADANTVTIRRLNPADGKMTDAVDRDKALENLRKILSPADMPDKLSWPLSFNSSATRAVYMFAGDIFLLDFNKSEFVRVTQTDIDEKDAKFSPDGKKISFVRDSDLYVYNILNNSETRITTDGSQTLLNGTLSYVYWEEIFGRRDTAYWWSPDSNSIAYLKSDNSPVDIESFINFKSFKPAVITQRYPRAGRQNPIVRLFIADVNGNYLSHFDSSNSPYEYLGRVKWLDDSRSLAVQILNRDQTRQDMYLMDANTGSVKLILTDYDKGWIELTDDLLFLPENKGFIWRSQRDGFSHFYLYSMDGRLQRQITKGDWAVCSISSHNPVFPDSIAYFQEAGSGIYFGAKKKSSIERHLYRIKLDGKSLEQITTEQGTHSITFSPDGKYYLDLYSDVTTPPSISLHNNEGKILKMIAESNVEQIKELDLQYPELFIITARDGFEMPALMLKPAGFDSSKKYPVLVNVYGGPAAPIVRNSWQRTIFSDQILLQNGFIVMRFDNRSATGISKTLTNLILYKMWDECELNDLVDAAKWLKSQSFIDGNNIGVWGASGGGSFTLLGLTGSCEFKAGVAIAPVTDWRYYDSIWAETGMKLPLDNPEGYDKTSFVKKAKNLCGRLLIVHGSYDDNVHMENTLAFINALIEQGIKFELMIYPGRKHGISDEAGRIHLQKTMLEFWNRNLK